jgi:hypothetical protein
VHFHNAVYGSLVDLWLKQNRIGGKASAGRKDGITHTIVEGSWEQVLEPYVVIHTLMSQVHRGFTVILYKDQLREIQTNLGTKYGTWNILRGIRVRYEMKDTPKKAQGARK